MADSISVKVVMAPDFERQCYAKQSVSRAVNDKAREIAAKANGMATERSGIWHEVGKPHDADARGGKWHGPNDVPTTGGNEPEYQAKPARRMGDEGRPIGIVFTANHAAQKDNLKNNTLLKAR